MPKKKRKLRYDRLLILFGSSVIIIILLFTIIRELFFHPLYINYTYKPLNPIGDLKLNDYDFNNLHEKDGRFTYVDDHYTSLSGIDVSSHQANIDWEAVKNDGIDFAYLRLGYRGYQNGELALDPNFETNYQKAHEAGLKIGIYFFSQAIDEKEAMEEAFFVMENIKNKDISLPVVYDLETIDYDTSRIDDVPLDQWTINAMAFMQKLQENNYAGMIYTNLYWAQEYYDLHQILHYPLWFAQYNEKPQFPYSFMIWQYTDQGQVKGIEGDVDLDLLFIKNQ